MIVAMMVVTNDDKEKRRKIENKDFNTGAWKLRKTTMPNKIKKKKTDKVKKEREKTKTMKRR